MRVTDKLEVRVWRGREEGSFSVYEVPRQNSQTVLDSEPEAGLMRKLTSRLLGLLLPDDWL